jgi:hypothetical protein
MTSDGRIDDRSARSARLPARTQSSVKPIRNVKPRMNRGLKRGWAFVKGSDVVSYGTLSGTTDLNPSRTENGLGSSFRGNPQMNAG